LQREFKEIKKRGELIVLAWRGTEPGKTLWRAGERSSAVARKYQGYEVASDLKIESPVLQVGHRCWERFRGKKKHGGLSEKFLKASKDL